MAGGGQIGNTNAVKWTEDKVIELLTDLQNKAKLDSYFFLGKLLTDNDLYKEFWDYINTKFENNSVVFQLIKSIEQIIESNLVNEGLKGNLNPTLSIFTLKNKHNWNDGVSRTALTDTQGNDIKTDISKLSDEELRTIAELQRKSRVSS